MVDTVSKSKEKVAGSLKSFLIVLCVDVLLNSFVDCTFLVPLEPSELFLVIIFFR